MRKRKVGIFLAFVFAIVWIVGAQSAPGLASRAAATPGPCGPVAVGRDIVEPPNVEMWTLPHDAAGDPELILQVHRAHARFCYLYVLNGALQTVPPVIRVRRGERFAIRIVNDIAGRSRGESVASTALPPCTPLYRPTPVVSHYVGYLNHIIDDSYVPMPPVDTNLHLHGFEGPAREENVFLSTLSTPMHACEYRVSIPTTQPPGTYFYHPHVHRASQPEVAGGLGGVWIVEPDRPQVALLDQHVLIVRYRLPFVLDNPFQPNEDAIGADGEAHEAALKPAAPVAYDPFDPPAWISTFPMSGGGVTLDRTGCNGYASDSVVTVDGARTPAELSVPAARTQLLRIVNGTSDTSKLLQMRDASGRVLPMHVVGLDGVPVSGDYAYPLAGYIAMKRVMLSPMARADVLLTMEPGATATLSSEHYCEGKDAFFQMRHDLLHVRAAATASQPAATVASTPVDVAQTPAAKLVAFARSHRALVHRRAITFTEYAFPNTKTTPSHPGYYITDTTNPDFHEHPFQPVYAAGATVPSNPDIVVHQGAVEEWYLVNTTMEAHAFHIHQMSFVIEDGFAGIPLSGDTAFVPVGTLLPNRSDPNYPLIRPRITKILLDFRHVRKGTFVFHCHMLFHEDNGMMAIIRVV